MSSSLAGPACFSAYQVGQNCAAYSPNVSTRKNSGQRNRMRAAAAAFHSTGARNTSASTTSTVRGFQNCTAAS